MAGEQPPGDYEVGYGKPPKQSQFQPGKSGNPKGRPTGSRNLSTQMIRALSEKVTVVKDGRRVKLTMLEVIIKQQIKQAASGNAHATRIMLNLAQQIEAQTVQELERATRTEERPFSQEDASVLASLHARLFGKGGSDDA